MADDLEIISVIGANGQPLPVHGNSIGSNWSAPVKQERADEAEIRELAAKMMETQKAALAKQQQQAAQMASRQTAISLNGMQPPIAPSSNGQTNILNYLSRPQQRNLPNGTTPSAVSATNTNGNCSGNLSNGGAASADAATKKTSPPCDEESQKGHFGWTTFGKTFIPYIYRQQEKYCSVRMIELKLLGKYLNALHQDIYSSCTCVRSYYITEAEARLLIEINHKHCDGDFGREVFTQKDLVVRLSDATKFYQFLDICYRKLITGNKSPSEKCGFIRINKESVVPYTMRCNEQVVPLFYFEGETENLKQKADYLCGWDLAYLKFCCKVQGIRNELFSSESVAVISLTDIKSYFPNGTEFEEYWPSKVVDSNLLIGNRSSVNNAVNWTRQPSQPPPKVPSSHQTQKSSHSAAAAAAVAQQQQQQQQQQQMLKRSQSNANAYAQTAAAVAAAAMQQTNQQQRLHTNALAQATVQAITNGSWMPQPQSNLPLLHAQMLSSQVQQPHANSRNAYRSPMENLILGNRQTYNYNNPAISMQPVNSHGQGNAPPPLVRAAAGQNGNHMSNVQQILLQQQTQQQQQQRHINSSASSSLTVPNSLTSNANNNHNNINKNTGNLSPYFNLHSPTSSVSPTSALAGCTSAASGASPATMADYTNLAFWNQLTPTQRLLLTQQIKNSKAYLGGSASAKGSAFPPIPSLPLDTDLKTMLDYNPSKHQNACLAGSSATTSSNGQFTKPTVPPLMPVVPMDSASQPSLHTTKRGSGSVSNSNNNNIGSRSSNYATVPLNSSAALEDFEKKFKMTDEMKAVVQKVLSNPDLSTFIQTNASNTFVPFISPPVSPATTGCPSAAATAAASLSILNNPNVTITPHIPSHFSQRSSSHSPSSSGRQKSVICSTGSGSGSLNVPPSPSTSNSTSTPSPSPTRSGYNGIGTTSKNSNNHHQYPSHLPPIQNYHHHQHQQKQHHNHHNHHQQQQQQEQSSQPNTSPMEVIDLSSSRRSLQAAAYLQQQQQVQQHAHQAALAVQQQRIAAAAVHLSQHQQQQQQQQQQQNGRSSLSAANSASMNLQRHAAMAASAANAAAAAMADNSQRLCIIPEVPPNNLSTVPYKVQKLYVGSQVVPCINMKAYSDCEMLMTLTDFQKHFFPHIPLDQCKRLIEALEIELYKGNRRQSQTLMEFDRSHNENIPLVQVRDIKKHMTQFSFMIRNQEPPAKRTRIS